MVTGAVCRDMLGFDVLGALHGWQHPCLLGPSLRRHVSAATCLSHRHAERAEHSGGWLE